MLLGTEALYDMSVGFLKLMTPTCGRVNHFVYEEEGDDVHPIPWSVHLRSLHENRECNSCSSLFFFGRVLHRSACDTSPNLRFRRTCGWALVVRGVNVCSSSDTIGGGCPVVVTGTRKKEDMSTARCQNNWALNAPPPESSIVSQVCAQQQA